MLIAKAAESAPTQTIRLEQGPVTISANPSKKA